MARTVQPQPDGVYILVREWNDMAPEERRSVDSALQTAAVATQSANYADTQDAMLKAADIVTWMPRSYHASLQPPELVAVLDTALPHDQSENAALKHFR